METLLIQSSPFVTHRAWNYLEHLGLGYLEKALQSQGFSIDVFDATLYWHDVKTTASRIISSKQQYGLVGFSVNRSNFSSTISTIQLAREKGYKGHITLGGHFPTFHFEKILNNFPEIDSIIIGHGEFSLYRLCNNLAENKSIEDIPGLAFRKDENKINFSYCFENESFLKKIGIPQHRPRYGVARIITSRGCQWACSFCCVNTFDKYNFKTKYQRRNLDEVLEEVDLLVNNYGVNLIWLSDMDFIGTDDEFINNFCSEIIRRGYKVTFEGDCRLDSLNEPLIKRLSQAGFYCLFLGVESFVDRQIKDYNKQKKNFTHSQIFQTTETMRKYGMIPRFGFIMFDKDTTLEELYLNHDIISSTYGYGTLDGLANKLAVLPGTKIEACYLKDSKNCFQVNIDEKNRLKSHLYYTQYKFSDQRVRFVYETAFSYRNKFTRLQELYERELKKGACSYAHHSSALWHLRDQFGPIFHEILEVARQEGPSASFTDELRFHLDKILLDFCIEYGFPSKMTQDILEEEHRNPGERHP